MDLNHIINQFSASEWNQIFESQVDQMKKSLIIDPMNIDLRQCPKEVIERAYEYSCDPVYRRHFKAFVAREIEFFDLNRRNRVNGRLEEGLEPRL